MKVYLLQPDYSTTVVDYKNYDQSENLSALLPDAESDHVFLNTQRPIAGLKSL